MYERLERSRNNAWITIPIDGGGPGNFDADRVYVFFGFCYHLKDWIKNDTSVPEAVRNQVETFVKSTPSLALAGDLANGVKHLARDRPARVDAAARIDVRGPTLSRDHYASGRHRPSWSFVIVGDHGTWDLRQVIEECMEAWSDFLRRNGLR